MRCKIPSGGFFIPCSITSSKAENLMTTVGGLQEASSHPYLFTTAPFLFFYGWIGVVLRKMRELYMGCSVRDSKMTCSMVYVKPFENVSFNHHYYKSNLQVTDGSWHFKYSKYCITMTTIMAANGTHPHSPLLSTNWQVPFRKMSLAA